MSRRHVRPVAGPQEGPDGTRAATPASTGNNTLRVALHMVEVQLTARPPKTSGSAPPRNPPTAGTRVVSGGALLRPAPDDNPPASTEGHHPN